MGSLKKAIRASMFSLAHCAVLLAPAEDAFGHFAAGLGDLVADVAGRARN